MQPSNSDPPLDKPAVAPRGFVSSLWHDIRTALAGGHHDYTQERLGRAIMLLAIPMVLEMVMESVFAVVDMFWVSHFGPAAIAVVGITESMMTIIYAVAIGLSIAASAVVARRIGEKDGEAAANTAVQAIVVGAVCAVVLGTVGASLAPHLLRVMGAEPAAIEIGGSFTRIMLGGNITVFLIFLINAVFRGAGDAAIAMRTLWLANILNIVLGPCFIFGWGPFPELGVAGAAVATNTGRGIGVLYQLISLTRSRRLALRKRHLRINLTIMRNLIRIAVDGVGQLLINTTSWIGLIYLMAQFGSVALAGYTVAMRVVMFAILPAWGLSNAAATLVGQNLGANQPDRAEQAVWKAARYNLYFLGTVGVVFVLFAGPIVRLFPGGAEMQEFGTTALRIVGLGFPLYAYGLVVSSAFNGAGDTRTPTLMNLFCFWLWEIPLAGVLSRGFDVGPHGIAVAVAVAFSTLAVVSVIVFRRGSWKTKQV